MNTISPVPERAGTVARERGRAIITADQVHKHYGAFHRVYNT